MANTRTGWPACGFRSRLVREAKGCPKSGQKLRPGTLVGSMRILCESQVVWGEVRRLLVPSVQAGDGTHTLHMS